jgi:hypothetical protein
MPNDWKEAQIPDSWKPEKEGDEIIGLLVRIEQNVGPNNSMMYHIEELKTHEEKGVWGTTQLDSRMSGVKVGEEVKIVYLGLEASKKRAGAKYKKWKVYHREPNPDTYSEDFGVG